MAGERDPQLATFDTVSVPLIGNPGLARQAGNAAPDGPAQTYSATSRWRPWPAFWSVVGVIILAVVAAIAGAFVLQLVPLGGGTPPRGMVLMGAMLAAQAVMVAGTLMLARAKGDDARTVLALKRPVGGWRSYAGALGVMLGAVAAYTALTTYGLGHDPRQDLMDIVEVFRGQAWPLALLVVAVGAPLSEELIFRGFLLTALRRSRLGFLGAAVVTSLLWATLHMSYTPVALIEVFMIGVVFAFFLKRTGSLRVTLFCHAVYNGAIALVLIFGPPNLI